MTENEDYEFVPHNEDDQAWAIRFLKGDFVETVVAFGAIGFNKVKDHLSFSFDVLSSPDSELTADDENLQQECSKLLECIIMKGIEEGTVELKDAD